MSNGIKIELAAGTSKRLLTGGTYCDSDIIVEALPGEGGGAAEDLTAELDEQSALIAKIRDVVNKMKSAGGVSQ